jgi:hypothetical protein
LTAGGIVGDQHEVGIVPHGVKPVGSWPVGQDEQGTGLGWRSVVARNVVAKHIINLVKVRVTVDRLVGPVLPQATLREQETPRRGGPVLGELGVGPSRVAAGIDGEGPKLGLDSLEQVWPKHPVRDITLVARVGSPAGQVSCPGVFGCWHDLVVVGQNLSIVRVTGVLQLRLVARAGGKVVVRLVYARESVLVKLVKSRVA